MPYKAIVLVIMIADLIYGLFIKLKGSRRRQGGIDIPANVSDVYDEKTYLTWVEYNGKKMRLVAFRHALTFAAEFLLMALDAYAAFALLFPAGPFMRLFAVILMSSVSGLVAIPADYYDTMVIEEAYGFNRTTKKTFWLDQFKDFVITLAIMTLMAWGMMLLHRSLGRYMIVAFAAVMTLIAVVMTFIYPILSRVFNKFTPLPDGELKGRLISLLEKHNYHVRAVQVMDASRRSTRSNAYFTGFGRMKTIVLYDTLLKSLNEDEICAVFAHEMGHGLHKDTLKRQIINFVFLLIMGVMAFLILENPAIFLNFGFDKVNYGFALILIGTVISALVLPLTDLAENYVSRRAEYRADAQAVAEGYTEPLISGLKKLARDNFENLSPDPLVVKLKYSHPTLSQRIDAIRKVSANTQEDVAQ